MLRIHSLFLISLLLCLCGCDQLDNEFRIKSKKVHQTDEEIHVTLQIAFEGEKMVYVFEGEDSVSSSKNTKCEIHIRAEIIDTPQDAFPHDVAGTKTIRMTYGFDANSPISTAIYPPNSAPELKGSLTLDVQLGKYPLGERLQIGTLNQKKIEILVRN